MPQESLPTGLDARRAMQVALDGAMRTILEIAAVLAANARQIEALKTTLQTAIEGQENTRFMPSAPLSEHRRLHRMGYPAKIDADPELQAFIRAHIDRLTFDQLATAVAQNFPPERNVRRSAIHAWWKRNRT